MRNFILFISTFFLNFSILSQTPEHLIPQEATNVFTFNNVKLFEKISVDELINYEFMEELQSELFDGSTSDQSLEKIGIDLNDKLNIFFGKSNEYILSGSTFNIKDTLSLFNSFDDYEYQKDFNGLRIYNSILNYLIISDNSGLILRAEPRDELLNKLCDSIWYSRGNLDPFYDFSNVDFESIDEVIYDENSSSIEDFPEASEDPKVKNYFELRDSISFELSQNKLLKTLTELFNENQSLITQSEAFKNLMTHDSDGMFYSNNQNNIENKTSNWFFDLFSEDLQRYFKELFIGNFLIGDINLSNNTILFDLNIIYNKKLGRIYSSMSNKKFEKHILKYIPSESTGYFNYNIDLKKTYDELYNVLFPILEKEPNPDVYTNVLMIDFIHEFLNEEKFFKSIRGNLFGHFNGIQKVPITKLEFEYDEENFEYTEIKTTVLEDVPTFTIGMSCKRNQISKKFLNRMVKLIPDFIVENKLYVWNNKILNSLPVYILPMTDALLVSNDKNYIEKIRLGHSIGALKSKNCMDLKTNKLLFLNLDFNETLDFFPINFIPSLDNEFISPLKSKSGNLTVKTLKSDIQSTSFEFIYNYPNLENNYSHFLDLINAFYIITKK